jgi:large subunit ribosomal protein L22
MEVKARIKNLRIAPKKVRLVVDLVRGKKTHVALQQLRFLNKKSAGPISELIKSAIANAEHNFSLDKDNLMIKEIQVNQGMTLKRYMPRAFGRASMIRKKWSHVDLVLAEINPTPSHEGAKPKKAIISKAATQDEVKEAPQVDSGSKKPAGVKAKKSTAAPVKKVMTGKPRPASRAAKTKTASSKSTGKK